MKFGKNSSKNIFKVILFLLCGSVNTFQNFEAVVRESDIEGLVGDSARLPCEVDKESCGDFHSIKWYKGQDRVFIFSEIAKVKRSEGSLLERTEFDYSENRKENWLEIYPLRTDDEGIYKCEITYLAVKEACSVVQFVNLRTLALPTSYQLSFDDGSPIDNGTTIGPFPEGSDLPLNCLAGGAKPVPSVTWTNGTRKLHGRFQSRVDADGLFVGSNAVHVKLTRGDLGARYSCEISNDAMKVPVVLWVKIDVDVAPESVQVQAHEEVVAEGKKVTLLCVVKGAKPPAVISWTNGTTQIEEADTNENIQEDTAEVRLPDGTFETQGRLQFRATRFENQVPFTCHASNRVMDKRDQERIMDFVKIDVHYAPTVVVSPKNLTLNESMDFILQCEYGANPMELKHVYWYLNGRQIDVVGKPRKYRNGNVNYPSLFVYNASSEDMGEYTCRVANIIGPSDVTSRAYVSVQYRPEVALIMDTVGPISQDQRPNVTLICEVISAHPPILTRVRWFLNGDLLKELPECDGNETLYDENSILCDLDPTRLLIENVYKAFHGNYSCEAMNQAGWGPRSEYTPMIVHYAPGKANITYSPSMVVKGQPVTLTCNLDDSGRPKAEKFRWTRNSRVFSDVTTQRWRIDSTTWEVEANFTCVPINSEGEGIASAVSIDVYAEPAFITRLPQYHGALMNAEQVSMECRVECWPLCSVSWLKDNLPLRNDSHYNIKTVEMPPDPATGDFQSVLSILSWEMKMWPEGELHRERDNANYTCVSTSNIAGHGVSSDTNFRVEYPPEQISISRPTLQVREFELPEKIDCMAYSYPEPNYYWLHNGESVSTGNILNLNFMIERDNGGEYTCVAENRHGKVVATTFIDVLFKPECKIDRREPGSGEDAAILLFCRASANPSDVSFRWRIGNETLVDEIYSKDLESKLVLEATTASLGTYYCYVNNSVGESIPCEIDVTGVSGLLESLGNDNLLLYAIIIAAVVIIIIIIVILIICCRRQSQSGKYSDSAPNDKDPKPGSNPSKDNNGAKDSSNPPATDEDGPTFYENLPFHGIQSPPNKVSSDNYNSALGVTSRPSSQLSHQGSSGYGSTKSQGETLILKSADHPQESETNAVLFKKNHGTPAKNPNGLNRRLSQSYVSILPPSLKGAKSALARTASYFSVRIPQKSKHVPNNKVNDDNKVSINKEKDNDTLMNEKNREKNQIPLSKEFITSMSNHKLIGFEVLPHSCIIEASSKLVLQTGPKKQPLSSNSRNNLENINCNDNIAESCQTTIPHNRMAPTASSGDAEIRLNENSDILPHESYEMPTPAPRNEGIKPRPPYQNLPSAQDSYPVNNTPDVLIPHSQNLHAKPEVCLSNPC